ncbi:MAG: divergent polysaccharide deacetylase family protein [Paracoccaceae bacterium]
MRGFVRGLLWGSLAAAGGLVVVSQIAGPVPRPVDQAQGDGPATGAGSAEAVLAEPVAPVPEPVDAPAATEEIAGVDAEPEAVPAEAAQSEAAQSEAAQSEAAQTAPEAPMAVTEAPGAPDTAGLSQEPPSRPAATDAAPVQPLAEAPSAPQADRAAAPGPAPAEPPAAPPSDAPAERMASAGQVSPPSAPATGDVPMAAAQPDAPGLPEAEGAPAPADLPPPPPLTPEEEALLRPLPDAPEVAPPVPEPADPTPEPMPLPDAVPDTVPPPAPELAGQAPGVVTGRLPRIGTDPAPAAPEAESQPEPEAWEDLPPLQRYARPFENPARKPLFAILLQDNGQDGVNRAELAALDLPLSIVIDPLSDGAAERAAIWRAGGQEVVMAGTGIPAGAGPGDLEQSFQVLATRLPEAVAVIDADGAAFQNNRQLAAQVVPILAEQGRGLVTLDQGLNAADQVARREGLPAAMIFRSIDGDGSPVIRRYLDRAAFKAAQEGRVIVIGTLRPETVAGVMEWAVEGRASTVALAPLSAMLQTN